MGEMVELAALKFAVLALYEALENAERVKKGIKYYPDNVVAIRPTFLDVDKITKSTILKIAKKRNDTMMKRKTKKRKRKENHGLGTLLSLNH